MSILHLVMHLLSQVLSTRKGGFCWKVTKIWNNIFFKFRYFLIWEWQKTLYRHLKKGCLGLFSLKMGVLSVFTFCSAWLKLNPKLCLDHHPTTTTTPPQTFQLLLDMLGSRNSAQTLTKPTWFSLTTVIVTFVHIRNISAFNDPILTKLYGDICQGNICPGDICSYKQYLSFLLVQFWPNFFDPIFWGHNFRGTK